MKSKAKQILKKTLFILFLLLFCFAFFEVFFIKKIGFNSKDDTMNIYYHPEENHISILINTEKLNLDLINFEENENHFILFNQFQKKIEIKNIRSFKFSKKYSEISFDVKNRTSFYSNEKLTLKFLESRKFKSKKMYKYDTYEFELPKFRVH